MAKYSPQGLGLAEPGANKASSPKAGSRYAKTINPNKSTGQLDNVLGKGPDASYQKFADQQKQKQQQQDYKQQAQKAAQTQAAAQAKVKAQQNTPLNKAKNVAISGAKEVGKAARAVARPTTDILTGKGGKAIHDTAQLSSDLTGGAANYLGSTVFVNPVKEMTAAATHNKVAQRNAEAGASKTLGLGKKGTDLKSGLKKLAGESLLTASLVTGGGEAAAAKGLLKGGAKVAAKQVAKDATIGATGNAGATVAQNPNASAKDIAKNAALGAAIGGVAPYGVKLAGNAGRQVLDTNTAKAVTNIMDKVKSPKSLLENAKTQSLLKVAQDKQVAAAQVEGQKVSQKIELLQAKQKDNGGKLSNVDQTKLKQLKEQKQQVDTTAGNVSASTPKATESGEAVPQSTETVQQPEAVNNESSAASVPTIKAYGREIQLSEENGYQATDTPSGKIYSKVARTGRNNKDSNLSTNYYDANGNKLTHEQAQAVQNGSLKLPPKAKPATVEAAPTKTKTNVQIPKTEEPAATPTTRTLKPSETAHMPEVGGYTHSQHMAQDYADMLRGQEKQAKGGELVKTADGYKRTSEHSRFYRDFFKENGKPPTKADYLEQAKKELESGKDAIGAGDDYKKLLEREGQPVPRVKVESSVKDVPQGTSKVGNTALENAVGKSLKNKYGEAAQYDRITIKDQAKKAVALTNDREALDKVVSGEKPLPDGLRATALIDAIERHPELGKDTDLLVKLSKSPLASESSYSAQELRLAAERVNNSPVELMKSIREMREKAAEKKLGKPVTKAVSDEIKQIRAAQPRVRPADWDSLIEKLKC